jgi:hypothetical protein
MLDGPVSPRNRLYLKGPEGAQTGPWLGNGRRGCSTPVWRRSGRAQLQAMSEERNGSAFEEQRWLSAPTSGTDSRGRWRARHGGVVEQENVVAVGPQPGWLRMKGQTFPRAGPHAAPTVPGGTSRRTAAKIARLNLLYMTETGIVDHSWSPSHDQRGMVRPSGTSSADR